MKIRVWQIPTSDGPFRFLAESKELAQDHAWFLDEIDIDFAEVLGKPHMIGWAEDVYGLDLDEVECIY